MLNFGKILMGVFCVMVLSSAAHVYAKEFSEDKFTTKNIKTLKYINDQRKPFYGSVFEAMSDLYKGTRYDKTQQYFDKPTIYIAEIDLNNDGKGEYVARPIEDFHEEGMFCTLNTTICPFYVVGMAYNVPQVLGIITANAVDVGDDMGGGYKILKAFTFEDEGEISPKKFGFFETYKFDGNKKTFVNAMVMPGETIKKTKTE